MRTLAAMLVLVATVASLLVGVRQQSELRRLEQEVWNEMRRRDSLERQIREVEAELACTLAPRSLLEEHDRRTAVASVEGGAE